MTNAKKWKKLFDNFVDEYGHYPSHEELKSYIRRMEERENAVHKD